MLNKLKTIVAAAVLSVTISTNVQAAAITVEKGDTLWDLSRENNTSVENIKKINQLTSDLIHPGDVLAVSEDKHYTVKKGDTLWDIGMEHHVRVSQIKDWNDLTSDLIHPGLDLVLFEGMNKETPKRDASVKAANTNAVSTSNTSKKEINVKATAYTAYCEGCSGTTATGIDLRANPHKKVIAVDPNVIPLGSKVYVEGVGEAIAGDTGGAIKGNRIDVFIPSEKDAMKFGVKNLKVTIIN
ncbi:LysM peptidoglycan-binding and 3D domain-containing protein [Neobacillus mesonae]|uniref:LysM peptidoglycan-binding and 3D domain-containing protein n=1 Tax=Neobacillus mesonae TaxID=1193713 RepID=UPI00203D9D2D|nr:LysM peptidoglycan-binding and 3D domain-containing protein [Neobacillus mesonae]MCM3567085.1 LysM peptidoglycan-binding domain-containing protein [Neobacillus mesonae]